MLSLLKRLLICAKIFFAFALVYFGWRLISYHAALVCFPFPGGLREGAMMTSTNAMLKGLNPFDIPLQPQWMNQYGIVYPLVVFPWAKIFGCTMLVHRLVTAFFILASCALVSLVLRRLKVSPLLNIWAVLMLYASLLYPGTSTPTIDPGSTGTFFFLLTVFVPWFGNYSYKSLAISAVCGLLAFYTKAYVFLGVLITGTYVFLFVSRVKGLFYGLVLGLLMALSIALVNRLWPAYFDNCFFTSVNMAHAWASSERLHVQMAEYWRLHRWVFILTAVFMVLEGLKALREMPSLFRFRIPLVLYAALFSSLVIFMSLGRHSGAMMWYFFQLLSPFVLIGIAWTLNIEENLWPLAGVPVLILSLYFISIKHDYRLYDKHMENWPQLAGLLSQHQHVLNSSLIAPLLIQQDKEVIDDGQAEYFGSGGIRPSWMKPFFKEDTWVNTQLALFFYKIRTRVQNKDFDLIVLQPGLLPMGVGDDIKKYYKFAGGFNVLAPEDGRAYSLTIWLPMS